MKSRILDIRQSVNNTTWQIVSENDVCHVLDIVRHPIWRIMLHLSLDTKNMEVYQIFEDEQKTAHQELL